MPPGPSKAGGDVVLGDVGVGDGVGAAGGLDGITWILLAAVGVIAAGEVVDSEDCFPSAGGSLIEAAAADFSGFEDGVSLSFFFFDSLRGFDHSSTPSVFILAGVSTLSARVPVFEEPDTLSMVGPVTVKADESLGAPAGADAGFISPGLDFFSLPDAFLPLSLSGAAEISPRACSLAVPERCDPLFPAGAGDFVPRDCSSAGPECPRPGEEETVTGGLEDDDSLLEPSFPVGGPPIGS